MIQPKAIPEYTPEEDQVIRNMAGRYTADEISKKVSEISAVYRSRISVESRAAKIFISLRREGSGKCSKCTYPAETVKKAMDMHKRGVHKTFISKKLNVHIKTVDNWINVYYQKRY